MTQAKSQDPGSRVLIGISGGQSSAVAAAILKSQGLELQGVHFQVAEPEAEKPRFGSRCCLQKKVDAARDVCRKLDIPLQVVDLSASFQSKVADPFIHDLLQARTPNPCIPCNLEIRFDELFRRARAANCDWVATGHHVQVFQDAPIGGKKPNARLVRAVNPAADQSYFLFGLGQSQLRRLMTPIGGFQDAMVDRLAREFELPVVSGEGRQEICFLKGNAYRAYVEERTAASLRPGGLTKLLDGTVVGEHSGIYQYQLGQEPKLSPPVKEKYEVIGFDLLSHSLLVGKGSGPRHAELRANGARWVRPVDGIRLLRCGARMAPAQREAVPVVVTLFENDTLVVELEQPQGQLLPGQAIVFYQGEEVLGGAFVENVGPQPRDLA